MIIVLGVLLVICFIALISTVGKNNEISNDLKEYKNWLEDANCKVTMIQKEHARLQEALVNEKEERRLLEAQKAAFEVASIKSHADQQLKISAEEELSRLKQQITELEQSSATKKELLNEIEENYVQKVNILSLTQNEILDAEKLLQQVNNDYQRMISDLEALEGSHEAWKAAVEDLKHIHRTMLDEQMRDQEGLQRGWTFETTVRERRLIELIKELKELYPELKVEFAKIEWSKVWLPKFQELCNREGLNGKSGIYRLTLLERPSASKPDESTGSEQSERSADSRWLAYVGQSVNIKDRWYTHAKKLIGVEGKGNEKLYNGDGWSVDDFRWEVVEEAGADKLDEREAYWIEWCGAKEYGLNKKL